MNELKIFNNPEFGKVRTVEIDGEPWLVGKDVAQALGYANPRDALSKHIDYEDKGVSQITTPSGIQEMTIINESGLYSLVLSSKLPGAKKFRRWVTSEVLPSIRNHGAYMTPETIEKILCTPDVIIKLATSLKEESEKRILLEEKIEEDKPKVIFADSVATSNTSIMVGDLAKILRQNGVEIGQNRLFQWLRENKFLCSRGRQRNMPTQKSMEDGLFEVEENIDVNPGWDIRINITPRVTGKGQEFFVNKFLGEYDL